jgi:hypothetical protein
MIHYICYFTFVHVYVSRAHITYHLAQKFIIKLRIDCLIDT